MRGPILYFSVNKTRIFIHRKTVDQFMKYDPPCKECLVRSICLGYQESYYQAGYKLIIDNGCKKLFDFLENQNKKKE